MRSTAWLEAVVRGQTLVELEDLAGGVVQLVSEAMDEEQFVALRPDHLRILIGEELGGSSGSFIRTG